MRAAPAASAPLDDCRPERVLIALLYGATGAALAGWLSAQGPLVGGPAWLLLGLSLGAGLGLVVARWTLPGDIVLLSWGRHALVGSTVGGPCRNRIGSID